MYLALARKYRPKDFDGLLGQELVARTLKNALRLDLVHHAYLFSGSRGVGKTSAARIMAKALNCESKKKRPCNTCEKCREINEDRSLDVLEIDGATNGGIDEVRLLKEKVRTAPVNSLYKVYIIDEVHMVSTPAFNALLKTLEEPPPFVVFIFATTSPDKVPATILSRCQRFDFSRIPTPVIARRLADILDAEKVSSDARSREIIAWAADGSLRDALSLTDLVISYSDRAITAEAALTILGLNRATAYPDLLEAVNKHETKKVFALINTAAGASAAMLSFIEGFIQFTRTLLEIRVSGGGDHVDYPFMTAAELTGIAGRYTPSFLEEVLGTMLKTYEWCRRSSFPEDILLLTLHRLCAFGVEPRTLQDIAEKMMELYYQLGAGPIPSGPLAASPRAVSPGARPVESAGPREKINMVTVEEPGSDEPAGEPNTVDLFLNELDKEDQTLRAWFNPVRYDTGAGEIVFTVASPRHQKEIEQKRKVIEVVFNKYLSRYRFQTKIAPASAQSPEPGQKKKPGADRYTEAEKNPTVAGLLSILGGKVVSVEDPDNHD